MTDTTAPDAITQADRALLREVAELNADMPDAFSSAVDRAAAIELAVVTATTLAAHRRLAAHGAGEGLRRAFNTAWSEACCHLAPGTGLHTAERDEAWADFARSTPPTDAGSTTREGGEETTREAVIAQLVEEGRAKHRVLNDEQQGAADTEARAFYRKVIDRYRAALATTPSPDASPDSGEAIRFYKLPFTLHEPKGDGAAYIRDANGDAVAMLMWPGHSLEDTDAATEETYRIGRAMAAALPSPEAPANRQEAGEVERLIAALDKIMPISTHNTPDYAEVAFGGEGHSSQAMTMHPADWIEINAAYEALTSPKDVKGGSGQ